MKYQIIDLEKGNVVDRNLTLDEALMWRDRPEGYSFLIEPMQLSEPTKEEMEEP